MNKTSSHLSGYFLSLILMTSHLYAQSSHQTDDFFNFLDAVKQTAITQGISSQTISAVFKDISLDGQVLILDNKQAEFSRTFAQYLATRLSKQRLSLAKKYHQSYRDLLYLIAQQYGVAGHILVAFWGLETNFGKNSGTFNAIRSLATLAFNPRRRSFFKGELLTALHLIDKKQIPNNANSSWAGAIGDMQFMPSNIKMYAVDVHKDGLNLWGDLADIFASAANFLKSLGWQAHKRWGREVRLPVLFDYSQASLDNKKPLHYWNRLGVRMTNGSKLPKSQLLGAIILPAGHRGPAFLVYDNFQVILKWNRSIFYALSVGLLADNIADGTTLYRQGQITAALKRSDIKKAQQKLIDLDFLNDNADGIIGRKTRAALRQFQQLINVPADGYLDKRMLDLLDF